LASFIFFAQTAVDHKRPKWKQRCEKHKRRPPKAPLHGIPRQHQGNEKPDKEYSMHPSDNTDGFRQIGKVF
jgi:hypothetical protein